MEMTAIMIIMTTITREGLMTTMTEDVVVVAEVQNEGGEDREAVEGALTMTENASLGTLVGAVEVGETEAHLIEILASTDISTYHFILFTVSLRKTSPVCSIAAVLFDAYDMIHYSGM